MTGYQFWRFSEGISSTTSISSPYSFNLATLWIRCWPQAVIDLPVSTMYRAALFNTCWSSSNDGTNWTWGIAKLISIKKSGFLSFSDRKFQRNWTARKWPRVYHFESIFWPVSEILGLINPSWIDESFVFFELMTRFLMISSDCFKQKVIFSRHRFLKYWITSRQFCSKTDSFFSSPRFEAFEFAAVGASARVWRTSMLKSGGTSVGSSWDTKTYK